MTRNRAIAASRENNSGLRLKRPSWKDPRLLVGLLLVLASVVGVVLLVARLDHTVPVYVAKSELHYGQAISEEDFMTVQVNLGEASDKYVLATDDVPENMLAVRPVKSGELIAKAALDEAPPPGEQSLMLALPVENISGLLPGDEIEIWVAERRGPQEFADPSKVVTKGTLADLDNQQTTLGPVNTVKVRIWLPSSDIPKILKSQSNQSQIFLVGRATNEG